MKKKNERAGTRTIYEEKEYEVNEWINCFDKKLISDWGSLSHPNNI